MLASPVLDAGKQCMTLCEILLNFFAPIENGTVTGGAQNILMQATLAPLALGPEGTEGELKVIHCAECFLVHSAFLQPETMCDVEGGHPPAQDMPLPAHPAIQGFCYETPGLVDVQLKTSWAPCCHTQHSLA